ncbi:MAG: FecR domain-containing protein [Chitinophagales bacterium]|nr:FecR domain-containing protein [Chitinophagales bacterium]
MTQEDFQILLYKKLTEGINPEEQSRLDAWLAESETNRRIAAEIETVFQMDTPEIPQVDIAAELAAVKQRLEPAAPPMEVRRSRRSWWWAAAAGLALLAAAIFLLRNNGDSATWTAFENPDERVREIKLPDGSKVWLKQGSRLSWRSEKGQRETQLAGQAFFEVKSDSSSRFSVDIGAQKVEVLGTSFEIVADENATEVSVRVRTGRVRFSAPATEAILNAGEMGLKTAARSDIAVQPIEPNSSGDWREKSLRFNKTPLPEVAERLGRYFGCTLEISPELSGCTYSGFLPDPQEAGVMETLAQVYGASLEKSKGVYRLRGGRCSK